MIQLEEERELRFLKSEENLWELSDYNRKASIRIMGIPEGEERDKGGKNIFKEIIAESFQNWGRN